MAVAAILWRTCMSATLRQLRPWIKSWAPPELFGGLPERGIGDVHDLLHEELSEAKTRRKSLVGCKADVRRCFDSVCIATALEVWKWLGAPLPLCNVISSFYAGQRRWFSCSGHYHPQPILAARGLLQGCPASPALLNGMMALWLRFVKQQEPRVQAAIFLDDRTLWSKGAEAIQTVTNAMNAGNQLDTALGLQLHPEKLASFANKKNLMNALTGFSDTLGQPAGSFTLLGIQYNMLRQNLCANVPLITETIKQRTRKIRIAARNLFVKRILLQSLVLSLFSWTGSWHRYSKTVINQWTMLVEMTLWGRRPASGRSRFLFRHSIGTPDLHPGFALSFTAVKAEWNRLCRLQVGLPANRMCGPQIKLVLQEWQWSITQESMWIFPEGSCPTGWCSLKTLRRLAKSAWMRVMWKLDTKTTEPLNGLFPLLHIQQHGVSELSYYEKRVLIGAAIDARVLERMGTTMACHCGEPTPTREHVTFHCDVAAWSLPLRSNDERRLLVTLVPEAEQVGFQQPVPNMKLVEFLRCHSSSLPLLAIDGSCLLTPTGQEDWQRASWGIAAADGPDFMGAVVGVEQTPHAGERFALLHVCLASHLAKKPVQILCDNRAVFLRFLRGIEFDRWAGDLHCFWHYISSLVVAGSSIVWIPSHGKKVAWTPPLGLSASLCRELNARADRAANDAAKNWKAEFAKMQDLHSEAVAWSTHAFHLQVNNTMRFWRAMLDMES